MLNRNNCIGIVIVKIIGTEDLIRLELVERTDIDSFNYT